MDHTLNNYDGPIDSSNLLVAKRVLYQTFEKNVTDNVRKEEQYCLLVFGLYLVVSYPYWGFNHTEDIVKYTWITGQLIIFVATLFC